jgi:hypothetical protein
MTDLAERMKMTVPGQLTWARPELGKKCKECNWCVRHPKPSLSPPLRHQCKLVFIHSKRHGIPFDAYTAVACSKFE